MNLNDRIDAVYYPREDRPHAPNTSALVGRRETWQAMAPAEDGEMWMAPMHYDIDELVPASGGWVRSGDLVAPE